MGIREEAIEHAAACRAALADGKPRPAWTGADLSGADLRGADLSVTYLREAYLRGADLSGANLSGANLSCADLREAYLRGADLSGADLRGADLSVTYLRGAYLRGANLLGANLSCADLSEVYLRGANLRGASLRGADLHEAYLSGANLHGADLHEANLHGADLSGTCLDPESTPRRPTAEQLESARLTLKRVNGRDRICGFRTRFSAHVGSHEYTPGRFHHANALSTCPDTQCHPGIYFGGTHYKPEIEVWAYADECHWVGVEKGVRARRIWVLEAK